MTEYMKGLTDSQIFLLIIGVIIFSGVFFLALFKQKPSEDAQRAITFLKQRGGIVNEDEIRRLFASDLSSLDGRWPDLKAELLGLGIEFSSGRVFLPESFDS